jgi:hypothetical protein
VSDAHTGQAPAAPASHAWAVSAAPHARSGRHRTGIALVVAVPCTAALHVHVTSTCNDRATVRGDSCGRFGLGEGEADPAGCRN